MLKVAVLCGGYSHEKEVSFESVKTILKHLNPEKYDTTKIIIDDSGWYHQNDTERIEIDKNDFSLTVNNNRITFDFAYIIVHGTPGEDGKLQAYFDMQHIPYNTCGHTASTITFDKWACNSLLKQFGVHCAKSKLVRNGDSFSSEEIIQELGLPCFVKPNDGGSSFGTTKVTEPSSLAPAINGAFEHGREVIIESCLSGTEVTCGSYSHNNEIIVLPATEIVTDNDFFDYEAKYLGKSQEITPARIPVETYAEIVKTNKFIYQLLGLNGIVRIDYMIQDEIPFVIEINTTPGMSAASIIPQQAREIGLPLSDLLDSVISNSM